LKKKSAGYLNSNAASAYHRRKEFSMTVEAAIRTLTAFTRSVGHADPVRDVLAVRAGIVARRLRARPKLYARDIELLNAIGAL
jgi:hypothetical protein